MGVSLVCGVGPCFPLHSACAGRSALRQGQLDIILREWYQHPNGQIPAYEWNFGDVNPPVIGWAAWRVYKIEQQTNRQRRPRLPRNRLPQAADRFTWWVNRKDSGGSNIFQGGFLGLDNIGVFDRSASFPDGTLEQSDGTSWMGMFCLNMMRIALELARENPVYENIATKFFEHFLGIAAAMNNLGGKGIGLWDEPDEFYYDVLHTPGGPLSAVTGPIARGADAAAGRGNAGAGACSTRCPDFSERLEWYLAHRPDLASLISRWHEPGSGERRLVALTRGHRMKCLLRRMLDPERISERLRRPLPEQVSRATSLCS